MVGEEPMTDDNDSSIEGAGHLIPQASKKSKSGSDDGFGIAPGRGICVQEMGVCRAEGEARDRRRRPLLVRFSQRCEQTTRRFLQVFRRVGIDIISNATSRLRSQDLVELLQDLPPPFPNLGRRGFGGVAKFTPAFETPCPHHFLLLFFDPLVSDRGGIPLCDLLPRFYIRGGAENEHASNVGAAGVGDAGVVDVGGEEVEGGYVVYFVEGVGTIGGVNVIGATGDARIRFAGEGCVESGARAAEDIVFDYPVDLESEKQGL